MVKSESSALDCGIRHTSPCERPMKESKIGFSPTLLKGEITLIFSVWDAHCHPHPKIRRRSLKITGRKISVNAVDQTPYGQPDQTL